MAISKVFYFASANESPQCGRLAYVSATSLSFTPFAGNLIKINGVIYPIPTAGIAGLANTGVYVNGVAGQNLASSTTYYVYCFVNAGVLTADFSTTGRATDTSSGNVGVQIKSGDSTRTLIGLIFSNGSSQFYSYILSWFNRKSVTAISSGGNLTGTNTSSAVEFTFLVFPNWSEEAVTTLCEGQVSATGTYARFDVGIDSSVFSGVGQYAYQTSGYTGNTPTALTLGGTGQPSEGFHTYQLIAYSASGSGTWIINNVQFCVTTRG